MTDQLRKAIERMAEYWVHGGDLRDDDGGHPFSAAQGERRVVLATDHATAAAALREAQERIAVLEGHLSYIRAVSRDMWSDGDDAVTAIRHLCSTALKGGNHEQP